MVTLDAVASFVRERLAGYKVPRQLHCVEALPLLATGKVDEVHVRSLFS